MKNLIFFDSTLGNIVQLLPILNKLKKKELYFFVINSDVLHFLNIFGFKKNIFFYDNRDKSIFNIFRLIKIVILINFSKFDNFINLSLHNHFKNRIFSFLMFIKKKYKIFNLKKKDNKFVNNFFYDLNDSESINYKRFFEFIYKKKIFIKTQNKNFSKKKVIGLHCGSSENLSYKRWDVNKFSILAKKLLKNQYEVLLFGKGDEEASLNDIILKNINDKKKITNYTNRLNLKELIRVIKKCSVVISNDSAIMHIANLNKIPTIGIFGPTSEIKNSPIMKNFYPIRAYSDQYCNKYTNSICRKCLKMKNDKFRIKCLEKINVDLVYKKVENLF